MLSIACCLLLCGQGVGSVPDAEQFSRLLAGLHAPIRDLEMICEGDITFVDLSDPAKEEKSGRLNRRFQSNYAYRSDGAAYLDLYMRKKADNSLLHSTEAVLKGLLTKIALTPDMEAGHIPPAIDNGSTASLFHDGSPQRFMSLWMWRPFIGNPKVWGYKAEGWEEVDGHRCLKVVFDLYPTAKKPVEKFETTWIDLERGGHVLKQEFRSGPDVWYRIHDVRLDQFALPGGEKVWFPVHGELDSFANGSRFLKTPALHESYDVVRGSLVFNQNLPDSRFSVTWSSKKPSDTAFAKTRSDFREAQAHAPPKPRPRADPAGVEIDLAKRLAEADARSPQLDASPPSRRSWNLSTQTQTVIAALSVCVLAIALILRKRLR